MLFLHNRADEDCTVDLGQLRHLRDKASYLDEVFADSPYLPPGDLRGLELRGNGYRWISLDG
jgi:hypothetical protein